MRDGLDAALAGLRELIDDLSLSPPVRLGLPGSLELLARRARRDGVDVVADIPARFRISLSAEDSVSIYRIVQEALTNAIKHSGASRTVISVQQGEHGLVATVSDNGAGFDAARTRGGFGVNNMNERAELLGAKLVVRSLRGRGTTVRLQVPHPITG
jgi:signal transduction histidine kinase